MVRLAAWGKSKITLETSNLPLLTSKTCLLLLRLFLIRPVFRVPGLWLLNSEIFALFKEIFGFLLPCLSERFQYAWI